MPTSLRLFILVSCLGIGLTGCLDLKPKEDNTRFYVLGQDSLAIEALNNRSRSLDGLQIGFRNVLLLPHLDNPRMVTRVAPYEIQFAEEHRWGESLHEGIANAVALYLISFEEIRTVDVAPWDYAGQNDYVIELDVLRFEAEHPNGARVTIAWTILDAEGRRTLKVGTSNYNPSGWTSGNYRQLARILDESLATLAGELMAGIREIRAAG